MASMLDVQNISIAGMKWERDHLWIAVPEGRLAAWYDPITGLAEEKVRYEHEIWDLCPSNESIWMMTGGGRLGRKLVLWSPGQKAERRSFNCPDGAGAGITLYDGRLWLLHRHNRKLFCLDPENGKTAWMQRTEHESFSPAVYRNEFWLIESDPGPMGHWSRTEQRRFFFSRLDPIREAIVERLPVPFHPSCMAFDGERFWYSEQDKKGLSSIPKRALMAK
ncbi:MAG: hypothetical protein ACREQK_04185 [Candidatus Binatia bacterium]